LKAAFWHNGLPRFREVLGALRHKNGETVKNYRTELEKTDFEKMTRLIKVVGVLLQTKVYLFWSQQSLK
jgi:hypothetical protein